MANGSEIKRFDLSSLCCTRRFTQFTRGRRSRACLLSCITAACIALAQEIARIISIDRLSAVRAKLEEYRSWAVPHVWLVDPHSRRMYTSEAGLHEVPSLPVPELGVEVTPSDVFE